MSTNERCTVFEQSTYVTHITSIRYEKCWPNDVRGTVYRVLKDLRVASLVYSGETNVQKSRAIAGRTAQCRCKFRYVLKFTAASRSFHCMR